MIMVFSSSSGSVTGSVVDGTVTGSVTGSVVGVCSSLSIMSLSIMYMKP